MQLEALAEMESLGAYELVRDAQPAIVAMELQGMPFDADAQRALITGLAAQKTQLEAALTVALEGRNPGSGPQLSDWLTLQLGGANSPKWQAWPKTGRGQLKTGGDELKQNLLLLPDSAASVIRDSLLPYKHTAKQLSSFGENLAEKINPLTGRIHARFNLAGTATGRMSCSNPNLQQIPRDAEFRALFAAPEGRAFVIADYSQMELRCAAHIAGEEKLLQAYRDGKDTHALTAAMLLGKSSEQWDAMPKPEQKAARQLAKAVNFGLLYGQGAQGLKDYAEAGYGVSISIDKARQYRGAWFDAYPAFERWHTRASFNASKTLSVRTPGGRVRSWASSEKFRETYAYNTPVQAGGAEAILAALALLPEKLKGLDAKPIAVVHDEILLDVSQDDAEQASKALEEAMVAGMLSIFPDASTNGLVEANVARTWADKG